MPLPDRTPPRLLSRGKPIPATLGEVPIGALPKALPLRLLGRRAVQGAQFTLLAIVLARSAREALTPSISVTREGTGNRLDCPITMM